jgi:AraC-like DNA-binding protein
LAKIAVDLDRALAQRRLHGHRGRATGRLLASGPGWRVQDVICTSDPSDRRFEERHSQINIAIVAAGTFQYRSTSGSALMTPGSLLLGSPGQCFECGHEHGAGDRCISFHYSPEYFERIAADVGAPEGGAGVMFSAPRVPALRESAGIVAEALAGLLSTAEVSWEEIGVRLAARTVRLVNGRTHRPSSAPSGTLARVTRALRAIQQSTSADDLTLGRLASVAGLSPYHFLRTFERVTGLTPHQYVRRSRLRDAAVQLVLQPSKVIDVAFDNGFADVSAFNRAFRSEFSMSPRAYRLGGISRRIAPYRW